MAEPQVLVVAGLDPSGGAGLLADVRVCAAHGVRPVAAPLDARPPAFSGCLLQRGARVTSDKTLP